MKASVCASWKVYKKGVLAFHSEFLCPLLCISLLSAWLCKLVCIFSLCPKRKRIHMVRLLDGRRYAVDQSHLVWQSSTAIIFDQDETGFWMHESRGWLCVFIDIIIFKSQWYITLPTSTSSSIPLVTPEQFIDVGTC